MPGFKTSKDRLTLLGANTAGGLKLKPVLIHHLKILGPVKSDADSILPVLCT